MASGDLLLEVIDKHQFGKLNGLVSFGDIPVTVTPHRSMNSVLGVVSDMDLLDLTEAELLEGWQNQNVTHVQRIVIRRDNKEIPTKHLVLTFASSDLPETIETGYTKISVRPFIPNPRRCFQCQRFGHGSQSCRGRPTCAKCGSQEHASDACEEVPHCINCSGAHPAYSRSCPQWRKEKDIISLKVRENISFKEARRRCSPFHGTYADAARQGAAPHLPPPHARPAVSRPLAVAPPSPVEAAGKSSASTRPQRPATQVTSGLKTSPHQARSVVHNNSPLVRAPSACQDAMETCSAPKVLEDKGQCSDAVPLRKSRSQESVSGASQEAMDTTQSDGAASAEGAAGVPRWLQRGKNLNYGAS